MKKCKSCQKEIDAKANKCPYCRTDQQNWFMKHPILTGLLALFIIGLIGSSGNKNSSSSQNKTLSTVQPSPTSITETDTPTAFATPTPAQKKLNISYDQMTQYLGNYFNLKRSTDVDGQPRYMGLTANNLASLEIIGEKNNISQATLLVTVPTNSSSALVQNSAYLVAFVKNIFGVDYKSSLDEIAQTMGSLNQSGDKKTLYFGDKAVDLANDQPLGLLITVKSK